MKVFVYFTSQQNIKKNLNIIIMFAVVKTGGKQYKVKENDIILVEKLENKKGDSINLNQILLLSNDE